MRAITTLPGVADSARLEELPEPPDAPDTLENNEVLGVVNANLRHHRVAVAALARAERAGWSNLVSRRVPLERWQEALVRGPTDVEPVIVFA